MSDTEWTEWQAQWSGAAGPLPEVRARARREVRLHRLANAAFFVLVAIGLAGAVTALRAPDPPVQWIGWTIVGFFAVMTAGYLVIQRDVKFRAAETPREAVGFLERRLSLERRAAQLVRWGYLGLSVAFVFIFPSVVREHSDPKLEMGLSFTFMGLVLIAAFTAPWWVARRNRRQWADIDQWKRWMDEQQL